MKKEVCFELVCVCVRARTGDNEGVLVVAWGKEWQVTAVSYRKVFQGQLLSLSPSLTQK